MKRITLAVAFGLGACTSSGAPTPQAAQAFAVACKVDTAIVPLLQPVLILYPPAAAADLLAHPAVLAACGAVNGTPASAAPSATATGPSLTMQVSGGTATVSTPGSTVTVTPAGTTVTVK